MNAKWLMSPSLAVLALANLWPLPATAQANARYDAAEQVSRQASELRQSGKWPEARGALERQLLECGPELNARPCRLLTQYTLAYLAEQEARRAPTDAAELLKLAEARYSAVLTEAPQHEATLENLALLYRRLERPADAERMLKAAVEADRTGTGRSSLLLGRHYRDNKRFDEALASFDRAAQLSPGDPAAAEAILALYADSPHDRLPSLLPRLKTWSSTMPATAVRGYALVLRSLPGSSAAEEALLPWVSLLARQAWVTVSSFAEMSREWGPMAELVAYVAAPENAPPTSGWWRRTPERSSVLAELAPALAQLPEARGNPPRALRRLEVAMGFCPPYEEYLFRNVLKAARPARLEIARATLALLSYNPTLDPGDNKQRFLINELFVGKAGAYSSEDLTAMQRFHTTLGQWYAAREEWAGSGSTNARFQLERALGTAAARARAGEPYQPLADEKETLAGGYAKLGQAPRARSMHLEAAAAYLDSDQLDEAARALDAATRISDPAPLPADSALSTQLRQTLGTRKQIASARVPADFEQRPEQAWLRAAEPSTFARRQRFKVFADLFQQASAAALEREASARASKAFDAALGVTSMIGTADLVRFESVKRRVTAQADITSWRSAVLATKQVSSEGAASWPLYLPSDAQPLYLKVSADAVLAGRVHAQLQSSPRLAGKDLRYTVAQGEVTLFVPEGDSATADAVAALPGIVGMRSRRTSPLGPKF